ncbi:MAG: SpaA isopeptide-forming pilin-related protein, partial [Eubacteriales bacterium]|nr:SpaA isopeptide-forming pilin-related protein [Eubacteriales bacterium]
SGTSKKEIELAEGTYTLTETTAPNGYEVAETMTFKIEKGVVYVETDNGFVKVTDSTVVMYDAKKGKKLVKISKQEVGGGAELAGAKLTVKDSTGKEVASWTSGTSKKEIQLEEGTYTLTEVTAPDGYEVAETITFKVEKDAVSVKKGSTFTKVTDDTVVMYDAYGKKKVKISKQAVGGGAELAGAKLTVKDSNGQIVKSWTSGSAKQEIELAEGTYTLTETTAPNGYEIAETMTFKIEKGVVYVKDGSSFKKVTSDTVVMYDAKKGKKTVKISKQAVGGGAELAGAKLTVKDSTGKEVASWTSGTSKKEIQLEEGIYTLTEITAPDGYEVAETMTFKIEKGDVSVKKGATYEKVTDDTVVMIDNYGKKKVNISKQAVGGGSELAGAKLTVKNSSGTVVTSWTSGSTKKTIELAEGTYTLTEVTAPNGYEVAETITFKVEKAVVYVKDGSSFKKVTDDTVVMLDAKKGMKKVKISKQAVGGGEELVGAKLTVKDSKGQVVKSWTSSATKQELELAEGVYTLTETTAPDGYEIAETMTFKIEKGVVSVKEGTTYKQVTGDTVVMYDKFGKKKVKISKQAVGGGSELAGAKLTVKDSTGKEVASWTSGTSKKEIELAEGTYTLTEVTAPNGFEVAETMTFKIEKAEVYVKDGSTFKKVTDDTVVMYDAYGKKKVKISKQAVGGGAELAGAKLTVKDSTGKEVSSWTSGTSKKEIELAEGTYTLTETTAPDGYEVAETMTFKIEKGIVYVKDGSAFKKVTDDTVVMLDAKKGKKIVKISKQAVGGGSELAGAKLIVKDNTGKEVKSWISGTAKQEIELEEGVYTLTEITAPDGFEIAETITFKIEKGEVSVKNGAVYTKVTDSTVVMYDAYGKKVVKISKQAVGGGSELAGAKLTVKDSTGKEVASWTSGTSKKEITLAEGVYSLTEVTAPNGYEIAETITFKIDHGVIYVKDGSSYVKVTSDTVVMYDAQKGNTKVNISKQAVGGGKELAGAKLTVKGSDGSIKESWTSGTTQKVIELEEGTYTLTEITAPKGYEIAETITFKVEKGEVFVQSGDTFKKVTTVVMYDAPSDEKTTEEKTTEKKTTDEKTSEEKTKDDTTDPDKGKLVVTVIDEKTNKPVPGATVEVTGPDGNKQTIVTNSNGQRVLNNRDVGNYKVTVKKVPDGYNVTTDTAYTTNVVEGEKTSVTFKVDKKDTGHAEDTPGDKKTTDSAQTGDHSPIAILFTVMMVTLSAFVVLMFRRRKNS